MFTLFSHPISVIMPVYNTPAAFLSEAVDSILAQSFEDFEFLILDDCSSNEETLDCLRSSRDSRVKIIRNPVNQGITKTLNIGLRAARGKYIARMDSDDISLPERFAKQLAFMEEHPDAILCGSTVKIFGDREKIWQVDTDDPELYRIRLLFFNPGPSHPSVMFSREMLEKHHLKYDESIRYSQDYMMWANAARVGRVYSLKEILLHYRVHPEQVSTAKRKAQSLCEDQVRWKQLSLLIEDVTLEDAKKHAMYYKTGADSKEAREWYQRLIEANRNKCIYDQRVFESFISELISASANTTASDTAAPMQGGLLP